MNSENEIQKMDIQISAVWPWAWATEPVVPVRLGPCLHLNIKQINWYGLSYTTSICQSVETDSKGAGMLHGLVIARANSDINTAPKPLMLRLGARVTRCSLVLNDRWRCKKKYHLHPWNVKGGVCSPSPSFRTQQCKWCFSQNIFLLRQKITIKAVKKTYNIIIDGRSMLKGCISVPLWMTNEGVVGERMLS